MKWQLIVYPLAGLMMGFGVLGVFSAVIFLTLPAAWQVALLSGDPAALVGLAPLPRTQQIVIAAVSWIPPVSAALLFLVGYRLALLTTIPPSEEPVEITAEVVAQMAEPPAVTPAADRTGSVTDIIEAAVDAPTE